MNRIEQRLNEIKQKNEKAFITYMTAGLPDMDGCMELIRAQEEAGTDIIELGIPFSDPVADGPVIQAASYKSIQQGTNLRKVFDAVETLRAEGVQIPIVFMMYYNTVQYYGLQAFADKCEAVGVDGLIIPDLPFEEQEALQKCLQGKDAPILLQLVAPVSKDRIPKIVENARGFIYCVSSMGVTGQGGTFHKEVLQYLTEVKKYAKIPVMMGFGIRTAKDVEPMKDIIDGAIVGTHFINIMEESGYDCNVAKEYCKTFKEELNAAE